MKMLRPLCCAIAMITAPIAHAALISSWTFDSLSVSSTAGTSPSPTAGTLGSDTGNGVLSALHSSAATVWSTPVGNGSTKSLSANNWSVDDYWQFTSDTSSFSGITMLIDTTRSGTGPTDFKVQYSTTGAGGPYTDLPGGSAGLAAVSFSSGSTNTNSPPRFLFDFSSIAALDNNPNAAFRFTTVNVGTSAAGTSRIDNVMIGTGLTIPEPAAGIGLVAVLALRRRCR